MSEGSIIRRGNREYMKSGGKEYTRRVGTKEWTKVDSPPREIPSFNIMLVRQRQADGEPYHWSLFLGREGERGVAYQVKGDAVAMHYSHVNNVDLVLSDSFKDGYILALVNQQGAQRLTYWANHEAPPSAPNQAAVQENCQGWTIRVIQRLVAEGIIQPNKLQHARSLQQRVR